MDEIDKFSGLASEFEGKLEEFQKINTRFSDVQKQLDLDGMSTVGEKWTVILKNVEGATPMKLMKSLGDDVGRTLAEMKEKLQDLPSIASFPQEPTPGNENTSSLASSFTTITTLLNDIIEDPSGTIGACPLAACYADTVEGNIRELQGDAREIMEKMLEFDPSKVVGETKAQFGELGDTIQQNLPEIINLDLKTIIEKALADEELKVAEDRITQVKDDVTARVGLICDGMTELMTTAQETCVKTIDVIKSTVKDVKVFTEKSTHAFDPPVCTSLCFYLCCAYPDVKEEIDESLKKVRSMLESSGDTSVLNAIINKVNSFPVKDITTVQEQFESIGKLSFLLKAAFAIKELKLIIGDAKQDMGFDIKKAMENMTKKAQILLDYVKSLDTEPIKDVVVKCEKLTGDGFSEVADALGKAREAYNAEEFRNILDGMYQSTDVVQMFSRLVEKVIDITNKVLGLLGGDQGEDELKELRSALALLSTAGGVVKKTNDMCSSCLDAASKGEELKNFISDLDEMMKNMQESFEDLAKAAKVGGGLKKVSGFMSSVLKVN